MEDHLKLPKTFREIVLSRITYTYDVVSKTSPPPGVILNILLYIYITSIAFYSLLPSDAKVIVESSNVHNIINAITLIYRNTATNLRIENSLLLFYITLCCYILSILFFEFGYFIIRKTGRLSIFFAFLLELNGLIFTRILMLAFTGFMGSSLHAIVASKGKCSFLIYFVFLVCVFIEYFQISIVCQALNNRLSYKRGRSWGWIPTSQIRAISLMQLYGLITRVAECSGDVDKYYWIGIGIFLLIIFCFVSFMLPIVIDIKMNAMFISGSFGGLVAMVLITFWKGFSSIPIPSDLIVVSYPILIIILYFIILLLLKARENKAMALLDRWSDTGEEIDKLFRNWFKFLYTFRVGFEKGHPAVLSWDIVTEALKVWPENELIRRQHITFISAFASDFVLFEDTVNKFSENFADKSQSAYIFVNFAKKIIDSRIKTSSPKILREITIMNTRIKDLQSSIALFWELVFNEKMNHLYYQAEKSAKSFRIIDSNYEKLAKIYPNSYVVTKNYGKYLEELVGDETMAINMKNVAKIAHESKDLIVDQTDDDMHEMFPHLPHKKGKVDIFKNIIIEEQKSKGDLSSNINESCSSDLYEQKDFNRYSDAFFKGYKSHEISCLKIATIIFQIIVFLACIIVPGIFLLVTLQLQRDSIKLMAYISHFPVSISRATMAITLDALRRESLILSSSDIHQSYGEELVSLSELCDQIKKILEYVIDKSGKLKTFNEGFNSKVQTYLSLHSLTMLKFELNQLYIYQSTIEEAIMAIQISIGILGSSDKNEKWILNRDKNFYTLILNCEEIMIELFNYIDVVTNSISEYSERSILLCKKMVFGCYAVSIILSIWEASCIIKVRLFFERFFNTLMCIPRSAFKYMLNNSTEGDEKGEAFSYMIRLREINTNVSKGKHQIPTYIIGTVALSLVIFVMFLHGVIIFVITASSRRLMKNTKVTREVAEMISYTNLITIDMMKLRALSSGVQIDDLTNFEVVFDLYEKNEWLKRSLSAFMLDKEYGVFNYGNKYTSALFNSYFFLYSSEHDTLKESDSLVSLHFMVEIATYFGQSVFEGKNVTIDDKNLIVYGHSVLCHHYDSIFLKLISCTNQEATEAYSSQSKIIGFYMALGICSGLILVIVIVTYSNQMQNVVNFIISRLHFLDKNELLACAPLMDFLSGSLSLTKKIKDLRFVIGTNRLTDSVAFILSSRRQILWTNEAADCLLGIEQGSQDLIDNLISFEDPSIMEILNNIKNDLDFETTSFVTTNRTEMTKKIIRIVSMLDKETIKVIVVISSSKKEEIKTKIEELNKEIKQMQSIITPSKISSLLRNNRVDLENVSIIQIKHYIDKELAIETYKKEVGTNNKEKCSKNRFLKVHSDEIFCDLNESDDEIEADDNEIEALATLNMFNNVMQVTKEEAGNDFIVVKQMGFSMFLISIEEYSEEKNKSFLKRVEKSAKILGVTISATVTFSPCVIAVKMTGESFNIFAPEIKEIIIKSSNCSPGQISFLKIE